MTAMKYAADVVRRVDPTKVSLRGLGIFYKRTGAKLTKNTLTPCPKTISHDR
jgi:hypothetical protein